jgi:hypothetical protein
MTCRIVRSTHTWSFIFAGAFLAISLVHSSRGSAATTDTWNTGSGNWSTAANWTNSSSGHTVPANGDTVNIVDSDSTNRTITYDYTGSPVSLSYLSINNASGGLNTLSIAGNALTVAGPEDIGNSGLGSGLGSIIQSGGSNTVTGSNSIFLGHYDGGTGYYTLSGGTLSGAGLEYVGDSQSSGFFTQTGGSNSTGELILGGPNFGFGTYNMSGSSTLTTGYMEVGQWNGTFNQTGGTVNNTNTEIGSYSGSTGTYNLSGGSWNSTSSIIVGGISTAAGGTGVLNVNGGALTTGLLEIFNTPGTSVNLNGGSITASALNFNGVPSLFHWTIGTLKISTSVVWDGAASGTTTSSVFGTSLTLGALRTLSIVGDETLGGSSTFALTVGTGGNNTVSGNLTINSGSQLYLSGGTLSVNNLIENGAFQWTSGTLNINGLQTTTIGSGGPFGSVFTLGSGQTLNLYNSATVAGGSLFTINGGNLTEYSMINNGNVVLNSGGFTSYTLFNQAGSYFLVGQGALANIQGPVTNSGEIELGGDGATIYNGLGYTITNTGLIHGDGVINMNINNQSGGELRAESGKRLKFAGGGTNNGKINLQGGTFEMSYQLTNGANTGQIEGRGTLIVGSTGLTNNGNMAFSGGVSDVFGDVHNSTGTASQGITISGNSNVTFWDDVTNGTSASDPTLFKVSSGSVATFFGTYSGNGVSGTGSVFYEADVSPGFSPASVNYGGNVTLDSTSDLKIELGGRTVGTQYDKLNVAGQLSLDGKLDVSLINGFKPKKGDTFDILDWGSLTGTFAGGVNLPTLGGRIVWNSSALYSTGVLSVTAAFYAGDFNLDGHVDAADIIAAEKALTNLTGYESQYGVTPANLNLVADVNGDGYFTNADLQALLVILKNGGGSADPVPEPASWVLAFLALAMVSGTRFCVRCVR